MKKVATSYYSAAAAHPEIDGLYMATIGIPGEPPTWVNDDHGNPKTFRGYDEALLAGFKVMMKKLNHALNEQDFRVKGYKANIGKIRSFRTVEKSGEPTVDSVFGKSER